MLALRKHRLEMIVAGASLALLGYVLWQGYYGPRSVHYREQLQRQYAQVEADLATITNARRAREVEVQRLRPESIDADLVDELARRDLNMAAPGELVVLIKP